MSDEKNLKTIATVVYALQAAGFFVGITWIVAIVIGYVKRDDARGTWLESHFSWQIRTFWWGLLWAVVGGILALVVVGFAVLLADAVWIIYRIVKGWLNPPRTSPSEPDLLRIGEDVFQHALLPARLLVRPELRVEQVAVVLEEDLACARVAHQEALELLGEHVALAHAPIGLG